MDGPGYLIRGCHKEIWGSQPTSSVIQCKCSVAVDSPLSRERRMKFSDPFARRYAGDERTPAPPSSVSRLSLLPFFGLLLITCILSIFS
jgi:hypothetical protein